MKPMKKRGKINAVCAPKIHFKVTAERDLYEAIKIESEAESCTVSNWIDGALRDFLKQGAHTREIPHIQKMT